MRPRSAQRPRVSVWVLAICMGQGEQASHSFRARWLLASRPCSRNKAIEAKVCSSVDNMICAVSQLLDVSTAAGTVLTTPDELTKCSCTSKGHLLHLKRTNTSLQHKRHIRLARNTGYVTYDDHDIILVFAVSACTQSSSSHTVRGTHCQYLPPTSAHL